MGTQGIDETEVLSGERWSGQLKYTNPIILEHLASTYVLGTLSGGARRRFERLQADRYDVRERVAQWNERLAQLAVSIPAQQPSAQLWKKIEQRTRPSAKPEHRVAGARRPLLAPVLSGLGGLTAGIALVSALLFFYPSLLITADQIAMRSGERLPQSYVGLLVDANANGKVLLSSLRYGRTASIKVIGPIEPPQKGHLVLWALPPNEKALRIGEVPAKGVAQYSMPDSSEKLLAKVTKLVVTLEETTEPATIGTNVVFTGNCAKLW